ncbi:MAG: BON domain-containing protein [Myxococcales bacterium]|nr:MAG: BON domain-containing protein [Myxococcales bacterium]
MNNRFGRDRDDYRNYGRSNEQRPQRRSEEEERAARAQPYLRDDDAESYNRDFERDGTRPPAPGGGYGQQGAYGQRPESRPGWYSRGHTGTYGSGGGGYHGGHASGGYGGSTGTDYSGGSHGGYAGDDVGYGGNQGSNYGTGNAASRGAYGSGVDQGYRGRDFGSPSRDLNEERRGGGFAGRGPKGYTRTDDRIREDVCDRLSVDDDVDATEIEVRVENGEVTLEGTVETRRMKHQAENLADEVSGVKDVHNRLRVLKGFLNELKDKVSGHEEAHYANTGTKNSPVAANGRA